MLRILLLAMLLWLPACGNSGPASAEQWLQLAADHYQADFATDFEMKFALQENKQTVDVLHRGSLQGRDANHYRLQAQTLMLLPQLGNQAMTVDNLQVADGEWLWMESTMNGMPQSVVLKRKLDELESMAQVNEQGANQLSPSDLNPLYVWRLALQHGKFELAEDVGADRQVLTSPATPEFLTAAAHRAQFWQPRQLEIALHRPTGAPLSLKLLKEDGSVSWQTTFTMWAAREIEDNQLQYTPPDGISVLTQ